MASCELTNDRDHYHGRIGRKRYLTTVSVTCGAKNCQPDCLPTEKWHEGSRVFWARSPQIGILVCPESPVATYRIML